MLGEVGGADAFKNRAAIQSDLGRLEEQALYSAAQTNAELR